MELIFADIDNPHRCGREIVVNGFKLQCNRRTSKIVTIPKGLHYYDSKLNLSQSMLRATIPICDVHEIELKNAFQSLIQQVA